MKFAACVMSVLIFASLVAAQGKPPAPPAGPAGGVQQEVVAPGGQQPPAMGQVDKRMCGPGKEGMAMGPNCMAPQMMGPGCCQAHAGMLQYGMGRMGGGCMPGRPRHCCAFGLLLLLILIGTVNILLTVIISQDMAKAGRFNGWWVPLLLIAGVPGSVIYALLRIGDRMQSKG